MIWAGGELAFLLRGGTLTGEVRVPDSSVILPQLAEETN